MKKYADSILKDMKKEELIEIIRCLEHNVDAVEQINANQFNLLMEKEMYKWHDLRKDPKDLPESDVRYLCARWDYVSNTVFYSLLWYCSGQWCHLDHRREEICDYAVVGWRYIEPFTEDEE